MSSIAIQVLTKLDRGVITVDEAERLILGSKRVSGHNSLVANQDPTQRTERNRKSPRSRYIVPPPTLVTLPTVFGGESSSLWM